VLYTHTRCVSFAFEQMCLYVFGYLRRSYLSAVALGTVSWLMSAYGHEGEGLVLPG
jgi:hypothetical protein